MFLISIYLLIDPLPYARAQMSAISGHEKIEYVHQICWESEENCCPCYSKYISFILQRPGDFVQPDSVLM